MKKGLLIAGAVVAVVILAGVSEKYRKSRQPVPVAADSSKVQQLVEPETPCTPLYAYVLSKGLVKQAIRNPDAATFPLFEDGKVEQQGEWFLVDAYFIRENARIPYLLSLRCAGGAWEVGQMKVNGTMVHAGSNL